MKSAISALAASKIREVANAAIGRDDVLAFWFGESDEPTPAFVREAAAASLAAGETFYAHNLGLPELRTSIGRYMNALHGNGIDGARIAATSGGVNALMIAMQALAGDGDEVVAVVPVWPNLTAQPAIMGAQVVRVPLVVRDGAFRLDLERLLDTVTDRTRVLLLNAPNNPTGWTLTRDEQRAILEHCRRTDTWIVADEVYERLYFGGSSMHPWRSAPSRQAGASPPSGGRAEGSCAPSFLDIAEPDDRLIVVHSFSKSFLMTGWRLGWLVCPPTLIDTVAKLIEFNTSCAPVFVQRAGLAALARADSFVPALVERQRACRDRLLSELMRLPQVTAAPPPGGMYVFLRIEGEPDSLAFAKRLVAQVGLGLAPGVAFGPEGEGWLRWCFASRVPERLSQGVERLHRALHL